MEGKFFDAMLTVNNNKTPGPEHFSSEFNSLFKEAFVRSLKGILMFGYSRNFHGL